MPARLKNSAASKALGFFEAEGIAVPDIPMLQPADPFLDTAGEALRRRIFLTEGEAGEALCLRPEFTIPTCIRHIERASDTPARYGYCGTVFRQRRMGAAEFLQAGMEDLGDKDHASADARSIADAHKMLAALEPETTFKTVLGDETLFAALLAALGLADVWQARLLRFFGDTEKLKAALNTMSATSELDAFKGMDRAAIITALEAEMTEAGLIDSGGRTADEIADRLLEKRALAGSVLEPKARAALDDYLALTCSLDQAEKHLGVFSLKHAVSFGAALNGFTARNAALTQAGIALDKITFKAGFGRSLDYYTGMVFEIFGTGDAPLIGGGRYDRLLTLLGATQPTPGVGFALWLDRLSGEQS